MSTLGTCTISDRPVFDPFTGTEVPLTAGSIVLREAPGFYDTEYIDLSSNVLIVTWDNSPGENERLTYQYQLEDVLTGESSGYDWNLTSPSETSAFLDGLNGAAIAANKTPAVQFCSLQINRASSNASGTTRKVRLYRLTSDRIDLGGPPTGVHKVDGVDYTGPVAGGPGELLGYIVADWQNQRIAWYATSSAGAVYIVE